MSDAWTGVTRFILLNESPLDGYTWSERRDLRGNKQPLVPTMYGQICGSICLKHRNGAKEKWAIEKSKLDNARQLRGIFFIEPIQSSGETTAILGNARQNTLVLLMPTKARDQGWKELETKG